MSTTTRPEPLFTDAAGYAGYLARKGAALLDLHGPDGWRGMINLNTLDIASPQDCILGQVYREAWEAAQNAYEGKRAQWAAAREAFISCRSDVTPGEAPERGEPASFYLGSRMLWEAIGAPEDMNSAELAMASGFISGYLPALFGSEDHPNWLIRDVDLFNAWRVIISAS